MLARALHETGVAPTSLYVSENEIRFTPDEIPAEQLLQFFDAAIQNAANQAVALDNETQQREMRREALANGLKGLIERE